MEFTCFKTELYKALSVVSRAVPTKPPLAQLGGILMRTAGDKLSLTGYNLEIGITTKVDAKVDREGELDLPAKIFTDIIRRLPDEEVHIQIGDGLLTTVKSGSAEFSIVGISAEEYPQLPSVKDWERISLPASTLKSMIDQTLFAVATDDTKPTHTGVLFDATPGRLTVVSLDGYRLALRRESTNGGPDAHFIIPGKTLSEVSKLLRGDEEVQIQFNPRHAVLWVGAYQIFTRLLEGQFLDYGKVIPKDSGTTAVVSTQALKDSVTRTSLLIADRLKSPLRLKFTGKRVQLTCSTAMGQASDELPCSLSGPELEIGFNSRFLLDALQAVEEDEVKLEIESPVSPMKVVSPVNDRFLFLVLPVRLQPAR